MYVIRRITGYLCLNIINFDAVDFSERRSEEAMFLLTLSVSFVSRTDEMLTLKWSTLHLNGAKLRSHSALEWSQIKKQTKQKRMLSSLGRGAFICP